MAYGQIQKSSTVINSISEEQKKFQEEALIRWVSEQIAIDKQTLLSKFPFTGNIISRIDVLVGHWDDINTACTNGDKIWVDVLFYARLDSEERLFVLAHECWHVILRHFLRKMNRNKELWNWATDLEIHFLLTKEGLKAPFVLPHDPSWSNLSFEEIYDRLLDQAKNNKAFGSGESLSDEEQKNRKTITISPDELGEGDNPKDFQSGDSNKSNNTVIGNIPIEWNKGSDSKNLKGSENAKGFDSHNKKEDSESKDDDPKEVEDRICRKIKSAANACNKRYRGNLPAHLQNIINSLPKNEISWQQVLRQFVTQTIGGKRHWLPPNRRHVWRNVYLQSSRQDTFKGIVALDTSGSCIDYLPKFFSELTGLLNSFGKYELDVIQCDADIQNVDHYSDEINIPSNKEWKMYGGGGTSHIPVFQWIDKNCLEPPNVVICLTDLYTIFPKNPPIYPVLWITTKDGNDKKPPFGTTIRFNDI